MPHARSSYMYVYSTRIQCTRREHSAPAAATCNSDVTSVLCVSCVTLSEFDLGSMTLHTFPPQLSLSDDWAIPSANIFLAEYFLFRVIYGFLHFSFLHIRLRNHFAWNQIRVFPDMFCALAVLLVPLMMMLCFLCAFSVLFCAFLPQLTNRACICHFTSAWFSSFRPFLSWYARTLSMKAFALTFCIVCVDTKINVNCTLCFELCSLPSLHISLVCVCYFSVLYVFPLLRLLHIN